MTELQKTLTLSLRSQGFGYKAIASKIGVSADSVRSYCRTLKSKTTTVIPSVNGENSYCPVCGKELQQANVGRHKHFCSDKCRVKYWSFNQKANAQYKHTCISCGKEFSSTHKDRKFCSTSCYSKHRFHGGDNAAI